MTAFGDDARPLGTVSDVASPLGGVVDFSPDVTHLEIGSGWATWSHGYTGDVYHTGLSLTMDLYGVGAFYFFAEPNPFAQFTITAVVGGSTFSQVVDGLAGAKIFAVYTDDFAVGEFGAAPVPEPSTLLLMGAGLLATRLRRRKA